MADGFFFVSKVRAGKDEYYKRQYTTKNIEIKATD